ncbi:beta-xylosidase [Leeuwenhoekiella aestuarii]|uniref:Beta-xylosidase n=2 Tax=Leeuwenhoekiella aestuarii TaxID=2249426 RepID=A0A4Q0NPA9_9FLAO|nr:beta-xylosidase [Leeuwenhoekiella aestuarii]RXG13579.1 beta-xylosidase [Leeuwenhoekiella aestuarii]
MVIGNYTYRIKIWILGLSMCALQAVAQKTASNPLIHADVPDMAIIRVDSTYYMSSTTMHMSPGVPIMKSKDLTNWKLIGYAYDRLVENDAMNLENGEQTYGRGSWASSLRFHKGIYYLSTFSATSGKTHIYTTSDIENGPWEKHEFAPSYHDHTLFFEDGKIYMIWGAGELSIVELKDDLSGVKENTQQVLIKNATKPIGASIILPAEGSQLFKHNGKFYLFNIAWPRNGMRTVIIHRADQITGPYEGRIALQDKGVAQGGLIDTPSGDWFSYLFQDSGAVGRIPYLVPVKWENDWPVLGVDGKVPDNLDLPANGSLIPGIVNSDDFEREVGDPSLPLVWQFNHNPDNSLWSVSELPGYLRLKAGRIDTLFLQAKNTLTQRSIGPESSGTIKIDVANMKSGDFAGLAILQKKYGLIGVTCDGDQKAIFMSKNDEDGGLLSKIELNQDTVYFKIECDFKNRTDKAYFYYSLDGKKWESFGEVLQMQYTLPHFMGYRFGLFNYATENIGGYVDFDYFRITDTRSSTTN